MVNLHSFLFLYCPLFTFWNMSFLFRARCFLERRGTQKMLIAEVNVLNISIRLDASSFCSTIGW